MRSAHASAGVASGGTRSSSHFRRQADEHVKFRSRGRLITDPRRPGAAFLLPDALGRPMRHAVERGAFAPAAPAFNVIRKLSQCSRQAVPEKLHRQSSVAAVSMSNHRTPRRPKSCLSLPTTSVAK